MNRHVKPQTMSSRDFNQHTGRAKKAADAAPLIITDRGAPSYVLMTNAEYERLTKQPAPPEPPQRFISLLEALEQKGGPEYDFEIELPPRNPQPFRDPFENDTD